MYQNKGGSLIFPGLIKTNAYGRNGHETDE